MTGITWIRWEITGAIGGKVQTLGKILLAQDTDFLLIRMAEKAGIFYFGQFVKTILTLWIFMYLIRIHVVSHLKFIAEYFESSDGLGISGDKRLVLNRKFSNDELQFLVEIINKMHRLIWHRYADQRQRVLNLDKELQNNARESVSGASITALSELAGGVAHQVNNPLTILEGSLIVAERMIGDSSRDAKKILELLNSSRKSVNRIAHVTRQLLKFSSQGLPEKFVDSTVNDVFLKINSALESVERATGLTVEFPSSDKTDNIDIVCSPDQVAQAIVALIKNSMEAIESSEVRWIQVEFMVREMFFEFSVTDSGIGLVGESETRVFLPFYTTKVATSNLGLGLTLAQGVAQAHRGKITIDRTSVTSKVRISLSRKLVSSTLTSDIERAA